MITADILADSINPDGQRITTFVCEEHRWILAEINTHRMLSRNSASSRAIPIAKQIERILKEPAMPIHWGKNQKGMQADEELSDEDKKIAKAIWYQARDDAVRHAKRLLELGVHKQVANRILESFAHIRTLITATEWGNFFHLRSSPEAQPEFQELAYKMLAAYEASEPTPKAWGEWHLPFADEYVASLAMEDQLRVCTARCARVSYYNFEYKSDLADDCRLHDQLITAPHASPFEHCAFADPQPRWYERLFQTRRVRQHASNFRGWVQYRKLMPNENRCTFSATELLGRRPTFTE